MTTLNGCVRTANTRRSAEKNKLFKSIKHYKISNTINYRLKSMKLLFITHCSKKKSNISKGMPEKLYSATFLQRFISRCKNERVNWAILSDKHGLVFPDSEIENYELSPDKVMKNKEMTLKLYSQVKSQLKGYNILFYHNPGRFHPFYKKLANELVRNGYNLTLISHLNQIKK